MIDIDREGKTSVAQKKKLDDVAARFSDLPDCKPAPSWQDSLIITGFYKTGAAKDAARFLQMLEESFKEELALCDEQPVLDEKQIAVRKAAVAGYFNDLIRKGGIATDMFKASLGEDKTRTFFSDVFFGIR